MPYASSWFRDYNSPQNHLHSGVQLQQPVYIVLKGSNIPFEVRAVLHTNTDLW